MVTRGKSSTRTECEERLIDEMMAAGMYFDALSSVGTRSLSIRKILVRGVEYFRTSTFSHNSSDPPVPACFLVYSSSKNKEVAIPSHSPSSNPRVKSLSSSSLPTSHEVLVKTYKDTSMSDSSDMVLLERAENCSSNYRC
jgi:hypothetical protein